MALSGPKGDWVTAPPCHSELPRRLGTKLFEKGTNRLCCPAVSCLFSVPCAGWFVKHVFRLIGSHIHLDCQGPPAPSCGPNLCAHPPALGPATVLCCLPSVYLLIDSFSRCSLNPHCVLVRPWEGEPRSPCPCPEEPDVMWAGRDVDRGTVL